MIDHKNNVLNIVALSVIMIWLLPSTISNAVGFRIIEVEILTPPIWGTEADKEVFYPGSDLFPQDLLPKEAGKYLKGKITEAAEKLRQELIKAKQPEVIVLPRDGAAFAAVSSETPLSKDLPPVEGDLLNQYFGQAPEYALIDPQELIEIQKANDLLRFMEFHSDQSEIGLHTLVLGPNQIIDASIDLQAIHKGWFGDRKMALLIYKLSDPEKSSIIYNQEIKQALPSSCFESIQAACVGAAMDSSGSDKAYQLEKSIIELSIQLISLEYLLENPPPIVAEVVEVPVIEVVREASEVVAYSEMVLVEPLAVAAPTPIRSTDNIAVRFLDGLSAKLGAIPGKGWVYLISSVFLISSVYFLMVPMQRKKDRNDRRPIYFPGPIFDARLGGDNSGGAFVGMSFELGDTKDVY